MSNNKIRTIGEIVASGQINEAEAQVLLKSYDKFVENFTPFMEKVNDALKPINDIFTRDNVLILLEALKDFKKQCDDADKQAKEILELSKTASISDFLKLDAIPPMTVLMLIGLLDDDVRAKILAAKEMAIKEKFGAYAKKGAPIRHAETNQLKEEAKDYWLKHIDRNLSAPEAADELKKIFILSHRKLTDVVYAAKKELKNT